MKGIYLNPEKLDELRNLVGLTPVKYTTYYNLAGPEKNMAVGRIDGNDVFVVEMDRTGCDSLLQENKDPKEAYTTLYKLYEDRIVVSPEEKEKKSI